MIGSRLVRSIRHNRSLRRVLHNRAAAVSLVFVLLVALVAILAPWISPQDPAKQHLLDVLQGPSGKHWLGTDYLGRDNLSRLIEGSRTVMVGVVQALSLAVFLGVPSGLLAGYLGGRTDSGFNWVAHVLMSMPPIFLAIAIVGILGPGLTNAMIAIGIIMSPRFYRVARAAALSSRKETYIEATQAMGCSQPRVLFRHVLPNSSGPLLIQLTYSMGNVVVAISSLSFLGLGAAPPTADWGGMLREAFDNIYTSRFPLLPPAVMIALTILAFSLLGDGLRDAFARKTALATRIGKMQVRETAPRPKLSVPAAPQEAAQSLLQVSDLSVDFFSRQGPLRVLEGASFTIDQGETFGLVGESGSGKSVTLLAMLGLIGPPVGRVEGSVRLAGRELSGMSPPQWRTIRSRKIAIVFQDPRRSLDPAFTIGTQIAETVRTHLGLSYRESRRRAVELLDLVRIPSAHRRVHDYPHQFSGGMAQRAMLAIALSCSPEVLLADEPTTALDVTVQAQVLQLIKELQAELGLSVVFVSHDLGVIAEMCDRVAVVYAGQIVEQGTALDVFTRPRHPYTAALLRSVPEASSSGRMVAIPGVVPPAHAWPTGCRFNPRCEHATDRCRAEPPQLLAVNGAVRGMARCWETETLALKGIT